MKLSRILRNLRQEMKPMPKPARFGELLQLGHVVTDMAAAIEHWTSRGVGPFYEMTHVPLPEQMYRGKPTDVDMSVSLSYSGAVQIELIVQHNEAPSLYRDFLEERPGGGLHHIAFLTEQLDQAVAYGTEIDTPLLQQWTDRLGGRYAYLERRSAADPYIELLEVTPTLLGFFEHVQKACARWDGTRPHRIVGE